MSVCPGVTYVNNQLRAITFSNPVPALFSSGLGFQDSAQIDIDTDVVGTNGLIYNNGFALNGLGVLYGTTALNSTDQYQGGLRRAINGAIVYVRGSPTQYCNGNPIGASGELACI